MKILLVPPDVERAILPALRSFPNQRYDQAPYGLIWYIVSKPFGWLSENGVDYFAYSLIVNMTILGMLDVFHLPPWFKAILLKPTNFFSFLWVFIKVWTYL